MAAWQSSENFLAQDKSGQTIQPPESFPHSRNPYLEAALGLLAVVS